MSYNKKPEMVIFDVGGTIFNDGPFNALKGLAGLRSFAKNPEVTDDETMLSLWNEYMEEFDIDLTSKSGARIEIPLTAALRYVTMRAGLHFDISMANQEEVFDRFNSTRELVDGIKELFYMLEQNSIRIAVISNNALSCEGLTLALKRWFPETKMEFVLTSADLMLNKPDKSLFVAAAAYSHIEPQKCWYCGDGRIPDVDGAKNSGMIPVLLDGKSHIPFEMRTDGGRGEYLTVNSWNVLSEHIKSLL